MGNKLFHQFLFCFLTLSLILLLILQTQTSQAAQICYFSLNSDSEFTEMDKYSKKLNQMSKERIDVREYQTEGSNAESAFREMMDRNLSSGTHCDGLVISGHHTGAFGGKRTNKNLSIDFLEKMSCDPRYTKFFENVRALWLQGCRTLGAGKIEADAGAEEQTARVGRVLREDHLPQDYSALNFEFSATLDQDNPLSSRYLRIFPLATTFGWTKTAPGEKHKSEYSIPLHIANIARINSGVAADPRAGYNRLPANAAAAQATALLNLLNKRGNKCEPQAVDAWIAHGNPNQSKLALANPDLNAYSSLYKQNDPVLKRAGQLDCILNGDCSTPESQAKILNALDEILANEKYIPYNLNALYELVQRLKKDPRLDEFYKKIKEKLKSSTKLKDFVLTKISKNETGILRKIDFFVFAKEFFNLNQKEIESFEKQLREGFLQIANLPLKPDDDQGLDYKETLFASVAKNHILKARDIRELLRLPHLDASVLRNLPNQIAHLEIPDATKLEFLQQILDSEKTDSNTLAGVARALEKINDPNAATLLEQIIDSEKASAEALSQVANAINFGRSKLPNSGALLQRILDSKKSDSRTLARVTRAISSSNVSPSTAQDMFRQILNSNKSNADTLAEVARAIGDAGRLPPEFKESILQQIVYSEKADGYALGEVARSIATSEPPISNRQAKIQEILDSPKADNETFRRFVSSMDRAAFSPSQHQTWLQQILISEKTRPNTLYSIARLVRNNPETLQNPEILLEQVVNSKAANKIALDAAGEALANPKISSETSQALLQKLLQTPQVDGNSIRVFARGWEDSNSPDSNVIGLFKQALSSSKLDSTHLIELSGDIGYWGNNYSRAESFLSLIANSPKAEPKVLAAVKKARETLARYHKNR